MAGPWGRTRDGGVVSMVLTFRLHPGHYAIAVLRADEPVPGWPGGDFMAIVRTAAELTIVSDEARVPPDVRQQRGLRCIEIEGSFALNSVGIVAAATRPIAEAGISLFAFSTWSADCLLISDIDLNGAVRALRTVGHIVR